MTLEPGVRLGPYEITTTIGHSFDKARTFFEHAHMVMPRLGFGAKQWWRVAEYDGEPIAIGFRTLDGVEGLNEIH